jgi:hypothetical protein
MPFLLVTQVHATWIDGQVICNASNVALFRRVNNVTWFFASKAGGGSSNTFGGHVALGGVMRF